MGAGMAANLIKAGHAVTVYNRSPEKMYPLRDQGAKTAKRVSDACDGMVVFTMLADDGAVEEVAFGEDGILRHFAKGAVHISSSTISISLSERLTAAHAKAEQGFVTAPVFGRPDAAAAGELLVVAAGGIRAIDIARRCSKLSAKRPLSCLTSCTSKNGCDKSSETHQTILSPLPRKGQVIEHPFDTAVWTQCPLCIFWLH